MSNYLFLLLVLACPVMMIFMMRGMHGGQSKSENGEHMHGVGGGDGGDQNSGAEASLDDLRRRRDELDREIEEREAEEQMQTPVGSGWR
jgi:hypothetical protein